MNNSRRSFLSKILSAGSLAAVPGCRNPGDTSVINPAIHVDPGSSRIVRSINGTPADNTTKVLDLLGGVTSLFDSHDIVIIKPNLQWWNQGAPNIAAIHRLITAILDYPGGFHGEVILAENTHRGPSPWDHAGWAVSFTRNSDLEGITNYNDLAALLKRTYGDSFSVCYWIDYKTGGKRIHHPADAPGYILCDGNGGIPLLKFGNGCEAPHHREVIMSYPIMKSDRGTIIDFKEGVWKNGAYTDQKVKYINCAALNHHSTYCGPTSAVKNYLGVSDLSGGPDPRKDGILTGKYYNFHSFPFDEWGKGPRPGMMGAQIGYFCSSIARPFLNLTTAEWVGLASRTDPPVARTRAVLASSDMTALDYHAAKYLLYPNSGIGVHNPDNHKSPMREDLLQCAKLGGMVFGEQNVSVMSWDHSAGRLQEPHEMKVHARIEWGTHQKTLIKYLLFRFGIA